MPRLNSSVALVRRTGPDKGLVIDRGVVLARRRASRRLGGAELLVGELESGGDPYWWDLRSGRWETVCID